MEVSGNGATFTENDIGMAKRIVALLLKSEFKLGAKEVMAAAESMVWFEQILMPNMEKCIFEITKVIEPKDTAPLEAVQEN